MKNYNKVSRRVRRLLSRPVVALAVALFCIVGSAKVVDAVCNQTAASTSDIDLWDTHGCWQDFFRWSQQTYNMDEGNWHDRGWNDGCNRNLEFPKHWSSAFLVTYGLKETALQFHGTVDYRAAAEGKPGNNYHTEFEHSIFDELDEGFGKHRPGFGPVDEEVQLSCLLFNGGFPEAIANGNPASRAGDFMHESWHSWMDKWDYDNGDEGGHRKGPILPNCTAKGCDYFYWHGIGAFAFGDMWQSDGTPGRFHSPNQVQVEYLCDVADNPTSWVPASVRKEAADDANTRAAERFINGPGYVCGSPRPW